MQRIKSLGLLAATLLLLTQCKKDKKDYEVFFWTDQQSEARLFIDGMEQGILSYSSIPLNCSAPDSLRNKMVRNTLSSGRYDLEVRDASGAVRSAGKLKLKKDGFTLTSESGSQTGSMEDHCVTVQLGF